MRTDDPPSLSASTAVLPPSSSGGPGTAVRQLASDLLPERGPSRLLGYTALFWMASTVLHTVVFVFSDTAWGGAVSWRKPIVFSFSLGLLVWTFGWILDRLPDRRRLAWSMAVGFAVSSSAEIGLIVMQQWRGKPSHFNTATSGDAAVFAMMGMLVAVVSVLLVGLFIWSLIERPTNRLDRIVVFAGLATVMSGLGIGQWIISLGNEYVDRFNEVPKVVLNGEAGVAKFPHAVAFHGIQVFMVAATLLGRSVVSKATASRTMLVIVVAYLGVLIFSAMQSFGGRAPFDLDVISAALLGISTLVLLGSLGLSLRWWLTKPGGHRPEDAQTTRFGV